MSKYRVIEIKEDVLEKNNERADTLRAHLKNENKILINLMSSPGSGKTSTLVRTIEALKDEYTIGVMEADIDSDVDAKTISQTGTRVIQIHTGGVCHLDVSMIEQELDVMGVEGLDLIFLENVGNLVCPAEFDTGGTTNVMILSVPERDDKPLKYPLMSSIADVVLVNKMDVSEVFDFDLNRLKERIGKMNPNAKVIAYSAKTGENVDEWVDWLRTKLQEKK